MDWRNKKILITGGTGSFGRQFCHHLLGRCHPKVIRVYSRDELKQHEMRQEFGDRRKDLRFFIGDVRDVNRLKRAMEGVDFVVHAAALKQVPSCEYNPFEAVKTNIHGAQNIINAAIDCQVKKIIALSTDKAVNPVNLYGATKLCSDKIFIQGNAYSGERDIRFSCVRYGNVIGSRGSVVPVFLKQKKEGVLTVTDRRMTRFWITLEQAVDTVVGALSMMQGGEIFIPKIPSMRVVDLARAIAPDAEIKEVGIRPGEKLHEILMTEDDSRNAVETDGMYIIRSGYIWWKESDLSALKSVPDGFIYASDTNEQWLGAEQLSALLRKGYKTGRRVND